MLDPTTPEPLSLIYGLKLKGEDQSVRYVGQTTRGATKRLKEHCAIVNTSIRPVSCWIRKHGPESVEIIVLEICEDVEKLDELENVWIIKLNTLIDLENNGLNCTLGGPRERRVTKWTDEQRKALSDRQKLKWQTPETKQKHLDATATDEYHEVRSKISKRIWGDEELRKQMSKRSKTYWSDETNRASAAERTRKAYENPEALANLRAGVQRALMNPTLIESRARGAHKRWHTNRGIVKEDCRFCNE